MTRSLGVALMLATALRAGAQEDASTFHPIFLVTAGVAVPAGELASTMSPAPTGYIGLAFRRGRSRTSLEIGESFTTFATGGAEHATVAVSALSMTRMIPLGPKWETYLRGGIGQSWTRGTATDDRILDGVSHFGVAVMAGTGLRYGGRVGWLLGVNYMALMHSGAVLHVVPIALGVDLR
ncbi:MAG TPA: hypothetical protein VFA43_04440 [Gemmatimonadaceae bacterium]|nr:hypothetical protein [Gemmatimonadaceae bacterium]